MDFSQCKDTKLARQLYFITTINGGDDTAETKSSDWYGLILDYTGKHYIVHQDDNNVFTYTEYTDKALVETAWAGILTAIEKNNSINVGRVGE